MDIDLIGAMVLELDADGRILIANRAAASFFGFSRDALLGKSFFDDCVPLPEKREALAAHWRAVTGRAAPGDTVEMVVRDCAGEPQLLLWKLTAEQERVVYTAMDVSSGSDHQHARSLRELSDIKHALDASTIVAITDVEGTIVFVNDKFCEISKYSREELLGQNHRIINSGHHAKEFFKEMWATIGRGKTWSGDIKNRAKDGSYYWVATTIVPFLDDRGKPRQYVALRHEITKRKEAEAALAEAYRRIRDDQQKLIQAEKLSSIGLLVAGIAHEVNNPLSGVLGCLKTLRDRRDMSEERREEYFKTAQEGLERIQQTMRGLLDFSRQRAPRRETIDLTTVIASALRLVAPALNKKDLRIDSAIDPISLAAHADRGQVLQALVNVLLNAIYASPERRPIHIHACEENGAVSIKIRDEGPGVPEEVIDKVFDPFFSTKPEGDGTGLGLSVTLGLLNANGGGLEIRNAPSGGAEVLITLPLERTEDARSSIDR